MSNTNRRSMKIVVDTSNIIPGKGGAGGGIWVYTLNFLLEADKELDGSEIEMICFKNKNNDHLQLKNIVVKNNPYPQSNIVMRFFWVQFFLPLYCLVNNIKILHRMVPEMPLIIAGKSVCTLHDLMFRYYLGHQHLFKYLGFKDQLKFRFFNFLTKAAIRNCDAVIVPSESIRKEIFSFSRINKDRVIVTHEAVDGTRLVKVVPDTSRSLFRIIVVAGFFPHKGHLQVLEIARRLVESGFTQFRITFRGNPTFVSFLDEIRKTIIQYGLEPYISIAPFEKKHALADIYSQQDCFLLLSEYEGFGLPVLEAQQFGLPVICSDIPVFREILKDSAIFINLNNLDESVHSIRKLLESKESMDSFREKGYANLTAFSWNRMCRETLQVYRYLSQSKKEMTSGS